jgi:hypothetical protein
MKFSEEIGTRCLRKRKEWSGELRKLVRELMLTTWTLAFQVHRLRQMYRSVRFHTVSRISQWVDSRSGRKLLRCERDSTQI